MKIRFFWNPRLPRKAYRGKRSIIWTYKLPVRQTLVFVGPVLVQVIR